MQSIILATDNRGKIKELAKILAPTQCIPQKELGIQSPDETGTTFIENAILKARHASTKSNLPALADDSGLVIPSLNGEPGIFSARYAGDNATDADNIHKILANLKAKNLINPSAYFYCAIALIEHANDPTPIIVTGKLQGQITSQQQGNHGFGYDPIFYLPEHQKTLAEIDINLKNKISHRAQALQSLLQKNSALQRKLSY